MQRGAGHLVVSVLVACGLSLLVCLGATFVTLRDLTGGDVSSPPTTVLAVVAAGAAFTAFVYHLLRFNPARRMVGNPLPIEVVRAHLEEEVGLA